jgi:hypothetical protein
MKLISTVVFSVLFLLSLNVKDSYSQYCIPDPAPNCNFELISEVSFSNMTNTSGLTCVGGYQDYTGTHNANVIKGAPYNLSVTIDPDANDYIVAFIDWNGDGDFDDGDETYPVAGPVGDPGPHTISITVPMTANTGVTRMRVYLRWAAAPTPCITGGYGEIEDYAVTVSGGGGGPIFGVTPSTGSFGYTVVGDTSSAIPFKIGNYGGGTLNITNTSINAIFDDPSQFILTDTNTYPVALTSGQFMYVSVAFAPSSVGLKEANLTITDDLSDVAHNVPLSGNGIQPNFGSNGQSGNNLYYFANSLSGANGAPSYPTFAWRDTSGSTILVQNGVAFVAPSAGTLDDGRWDILAPLPAGNSIKFFGTNYTDIYINTNGVIGFAPTTAPFTVAASLPAAGGPSAAIYPLWMDMNFNYNNITGGTTLSYKVTADELIITYNRVSPYVGGGVTSATPDLYVSFQVVISHSSSPAQNSMIVLQYNWDETGIDFQNDYTSTGLSTRAHIIGLQGANDAAQTFTYRNRHNTGFQGPIFGSNLAMGMGPDANSLPVDLIAFNSNVDRNNVKLTWTTSWEENNARFDIQRKVANTSSQWVTVGTVAGSGTVYEQRNYTFTDKNLVSGIYEYRLLQFDYDGNMNADFNLSNTVEIGVPSEFALSQNYPNPFNPTTKIDFQVPVEGLVKLNIVDITGREVATLVNESLTPGYYSYDFNASNLSSGVYFYRLVSKSSVITKRMMLVK